MLLRFLSVATFLLFSAVAEPYKPASDSEIVERLPRRFFDVGKDITVALDKSNNAGAEAVARANLHITAYRAESDQRQLGYAQAVLHPWWTNQIAPVDLLIARAAIKQSLHDFHGALRDLERALSADPMHAQALLLRATILQVQGNYQEARVACMRLLTTAPRHIAITALANVSSLNGEAEKSYKLLSNTVATTASLPVEQKVWMLTLLAEIAVRLGQIQAAQVHFADALALARNDTYALAAYADLLLNQNEPQRAFDLVKDFEQVDALLLRRALALQSTSPGSVDFKRNVSELNSRFASAKLRGDSIHQREEAWFTLTILKQPVVALKIALANWAVQREPADARLLLEAALAADNRAAAKDVLDWIKQTRIEDKALATLASRLQ